jgi:NAD(P)-dependent dehydrogenase (short-subunit alcohol dehydrogenase family)
MTTPHADGHLDGQAAIVTGAGSGMGRAIALELAARGAAVVVVDYDAETADETKKAIEHAGGTAEVIVGDVADVTVADDATRLARHAFGGLDVLVNNAGVFDRNAPCVETSDALWQRILSVNLTGHFNFTRASIPLMTERGGGSIVNMSSVAGLIAGGAAPHTPRPRQRSSASPDRSP